MGRTSALVGLGEGSVGWRLEHLTARWGDFGGVHLNLYGGHPSSHADLILFTGTGAEGNSSRDDFFGRSDSVRVGIVDGTGYAVTHTDLATLQSDTGFEAGSVAGDPDFIDATAGDFRVPPGGAAEGYGWPGSTVPPTVAIAQPANDSTHQPGADIVLQATAADADGAVSAVEYFWGRVLLGAAQEPPFAVTKAWKSPAESTEAHVERYRTLRG
jgi:hypothetical protein